MSKTSDIYRLQVKGPQPVGIAARAAARHRDPAWRMPKSAARTCRLRSRWGMGPIMTLMGATPLLYTAARIQDGGHDAKFAMPGSQNHEKPECPSWGAEYMLEGRVLCRCRARPRDRSANFPATTGDATSTRSLRWTACRTARIRATTPSMSAGPGSRMNFLQAMTTSAPIFLRLKANASRSRRRQCALHAQTMSSIVSTKIRYGGFTKYVDLRVLTTTHGLGYAEDHDH